jgi:seryl-tRNA synthetase
MSGATTTKDEVAKLQKRASEFETEAARADDLAKRLAERDQDIERLRKLVADRESLQNKVNALSDKLDRATKRVTNLTDELTSMTEEMARARQERDQLLIELQRHREGGTTSESGSAVLRPSAPGPNNNSSHDRTHLEIGPPDERPLKRGQGSNSVH